MADWLGVDVAHAICPRCGIRERGAQTYCRECFREYKRERREAKVTPRDCIICGTEYRSPYPHTLTCSKQCGRERERCLLGVKAIPTGPRGCPVCGSLFTMRNGTHTYCSRGCKAIALGRWSGNPRVRFTPEQRAESRRAAQARWLARNPDYVHPPWDNPEGRRENVRRRRAMLADAQIIPLTVDQIAAKLAYWGNRCWMCGSPATSLDHVKPLIAGGPHILANFRPACGRCNSSKGGRWFGVHGLERFKAA